MSMDLFSLDGSTVVGPDYSKSFESPELAAAHLAQLNEVLPQVAKGFVPFGKKSDSPEAKKPHKWQAPKFTFPGKEPACKVCGKEKPEGGQCNAPAKSEKSSAPAGANAPYKIVKAGGKWTVVNNAGLTKSSFPGTPEGYKQALKYQAALYVNVPGAAKRASNVKFSGEAKNRVPDAK